MMQIKESIIRPDMANDPGEHSFCAQGALLPIAVRGPERALF
jgi:hypothetical protein